jgi:hypothetical protein
MIVPMNRAIIDAPSNSPGTSVSIATDRPATKKHIAIPAINRPHFFALACTVYFLLFSVFSYYIILLTQRKELFLERHILRILCFLKKKNQSFLTGLWS